MHFQGSVMAIQVPTDRKGAEKKLQPKLHASCSLRMEVITFELGGVMMTDAGYHASQPLIAVQADESISLFFDTKLVTSTGRITFTPDGYALLEGSIRFKDFCGCR